MIDRIIGWIKRQFIAYDDRTTLLFALKFMCNRKVSNVSEVLT